MNLQFCSFDLETTGVDPLNDRIVTASCTDVDTVTGEVASHNWLANPGVEIPSAAANVHGVTTEYAEKHGQPHDEVVWEVINHLYQAWAEDKVLVVYNAAFDLSMLYVLSGGEFEIKGPVMDPLVIDRAMDRWRRGSRKLVDVAKHYGVPLSDDEAHSADADSLAAARVAARLLQEFPDLMDMDITPQQELWAAQQTMDLKAYLEKNGKSFNGSLGWPIRDDARALYR